MIKKKENKTKISKRVGKEFRIDWTSLLIPGIELIVLKGRSIRMTLMALMLFALESYEAHPKMTTMKSS
jgi:hypothetical protein